jgi:hypothetical protein
MDTIYLDMRPSFPLTVILLAAALLLPAAEAHGRKEIPIPAEAEPGVLHLLSLVGPENRAVFEPAKLEGLLRFVDSAKTPDAIYIPPSLDAGSSAYHDFDIRMNLRDFLEHTFHPTIPWFTTTPSSLRMTAWKKTEAPWERLPKVWELPSPAGSPVVIRGVEAVENTPDLFTGAYYRYELHRTLLLFTHQQRRVFISLSRQVAESEVGKKGYILGKDDDWTYFYSGVPGLNMRGLGWVKSQMFDSIGISIYCESAEKSASVRTANLKWVRAGWSGMNVVRNEHIHRGLMRFARSFKEILESPRLPSVPDMEAACQGIAGLTDTEMREKMKSYRQMLGARGEKLSGGARKNLPEAFWDDGYWARMTREEMEATLVLETLKSRLGKTSFAQAGAGSAPAQALARAGVRSGYRGE